MKSKPLMQLAFPAILSLAPLTSGAQKTVPITKEVKLPSCAAERIHVGDEQLKQLAALDFDKNPNDPAVLAAFRIIRLRDPRPSDFTGAYYYDLVHTTRAKLHSPVTDVIIYTGGTLGNASAFEAGNRKCIVMSAKEMTEKSMRHRMSAVLAGHEESHILHHDGRNMIESLPEYIAYLSEACSFLKWLDKGLAKDTTKETISRSSEIFIRTDLESDLERDKAMAKVLRLPFRLENRSAYDSLPPPSEDLAKHGLDSLIRHMKERGAIQRAHETRADLESMMVTHDVEAAEMLMAQLNANALGKRLLVDSVAMAAANVEDKIARDGNSITLREALEAGEGLAKLYQSLGLDNRLTGGERISMMRNWVERNAKNSGQEVALQVR